MPKYHITFKYPFDAYIEAKSEQEAMSLFVENTVELIQEENNNMAKDTDNYIIEEVIK